MADPASAQHSHLTPGPPDETGNAQVMIRKVSRFTMIQIAGWPDTLGKAGVMAADAAGCSSAPGPGRATLGDRGTLLRIEPLKWWLIRTGDSAAPVSGGDAGAVLDLTASRIWLQLGGPTAATLLNRFLPNNLSDRAFPDGAVASTAFHHVGVTVWRRSNDFNLFLPRSFATSLTELLEQSAAQYGS